MSDFQKPIVAPPTIFGVSLIVSALFGFASPTPFFAAPTAADSWPRAYLGWRPYHPQFNA